MKDVRTDQCDDRERLATMISDFQRRLYLYIYSLVHRADDTRDVLQETNLALWRDANRVAGVTDFQSWAYRVAFNQVLAHRKRRYRDRLYFDDVLVNRLAEGLESRIDELTDSQAALRLCEQKLPENGRQLLAMRYTLSLSAKAISEQLGMTIAATSKALYRIRMDLRQCIRDVLAEDRPSEGASR